MYHHAQIIIFINRKTVNEYLMKIINKLFMMFVYRKYLLKQNMKNAPCQMFFLISFLNSFEDYINA